MGINSTEISYSFGQLGSVYTTASSEEINPPTNKVFIAITMLEDTVFDATGGLIAETRVNGATTNNIYIGTDAAAHDLTAGGETVDEGTGGIVVDSVTFPRGVTIYGRWTEIDVNSGKVIAYIGA
tara:strand:+ start:27 stop:401 length:375 start_codon:yes stop_codon:yes gene_type:complete